MLNKDRYRDAFDQIPFSPDFQARTVELLRGRAQETQNSGKEQTKMRRKFICRPVVVAAAAASVLILSVSAAVFHAPVVRDHFGNGAGYQQSAVAVGESMTQDGWTLTLTDCVGDDHNLYIGLELTAPEGTVLDREDIDQFHAGGYCFEKCEVDFQSPDMHSSWSYTLVIDGTPPDNVIRFIIWYNYDGNLINEQADPMSGQPLELTIGRLYHETAWNAETREWEREYDCEMEWTFQTAFSYPDNAIRLEPDLPVTTLGVEATITQVEVTPIGVYVHIEGDALKGHHSWVPMDAPDGWYSCIEYQEITLHTVDGEAIPLTLGIVGSGCSGGEFDTEEEAWLQLARRSGTLLDLDTLESVSVCGVEIPLR